MQFELPYLTLYFGGHVVPHLHHTHSSAAAIFVCYLEVILNLGQGLYHPSLVISSDA